MLRFLPYRELWSIRNVRWLVLARFFASIIFYSTVLVPFQASRGLNFTQMFTLESVLSLSAWVFDIPTGIWADRVGYRCVMIVGYALNAASLLMFVVAYNFWAFVFSSALCGIGLACVSGCESALIYESLPQDDHSALGTQAFSLLNAANSAGFLSGLSVGSLLGVRDLALPFLVSLLPVLLALVAALFLHRGVIPVPQRSSDRMQPVLLLVESLSILRPALLLVRKQPTVVVLSLFQSAAFVLVNAIFWYNQPYFAWSGISVAWFGPLTAFAVGLGMVVALMTPGAQTRLGTSRALILSCLVPALGYVLLSLMHVPTLTVLCVVLIAAGSAWRQPIVSDELNRHITTGARATTLSVLSAIGTLMGIGLNPLIGVVGDLGLAVTGLSLALGLTLLAVIVRVCVR